MPPLRENKEEVLRLLKEGVSTYKVAEKFGVSRKAVTHFRNRWFLRENKAKVLRDINRGVDYDDICEKYGVSSKEGDTIEQFLEWADRPVWKFKKAKHKGLAINRKEVMADKKEGMPNSVIARKYGVTPSAVTRFMFHNGPKSAPTFHNDGNYW